MPKVLIKRGTRSQLDTAKTANGLAAGELYLVTDENKVAVGTAANNYADLGGSSGGLIFTGMDGGSASTTLFDLTLDLADAYVQ